MFGSKLKRENELLRVRLGYALDRERDLFLRRSVGDPKPAPACPICGAAVESRDVTLTGERQQDGIAWPFGLRSTHDSKQTTVHYTCGSKHIHHEDRPDRNEVGDADGNLLKRTEFVPRGCLKLPATLTKADVLRIVGEAEKQAARGKA